MPRRAKNAVTPVISMVARATLACSLLYLMFGCAPGLNILDEYEPVPSAPIAAAPTPQASHSAPPEVVERGRYMVELLGCGACHTAGALYGTPDPALSLAGSRIGIAHSNPLAVAKPGVVFPPNLTPDTKTGIGLISDDALKASIGGRLGLHSARRLRVMPVVAYSKVRDEDIDAIIAYLRSLPAVHNPVPRNVPEGRSTKEKYVHFGVYRSREQ